MHAMTTTEIFLIAMVIIFTIPYLVWRLCRTEYWAPLVVVQTAVSRSSEPVCAAVRATVRVLPGPPVVAVPAASRSSPSARVM